MLQDAQYNYRVWVRDAPQFQNLKEFRRPPVLEPEVVTIGAEKHE